MIFLVDPLLLPVSFLMHSKRVSFFYFFSPLLLSVDDLLQQDLIVSTDLIQIFLRFMISGDFSALVQKAHIVTCRKIQLRLFVYDALDTLYIL